MDTFLTSPALLAGLKAAAEPTRLRLLRICAQGELTVGEITRVIAQSQPRVSRHLKILCDAGLLVRFRERHWVFYRVPLSGPEAELVGNVLQKLAIEDSDFMVDQQRLEDVLAERARLASGYTAELRKPPVSDKQLSTAVRKLLGSRPVGDLLDIGTGTGRLLRFLGESAEQAIGVDISSKMLLIARTNLQAAGLSHCMVRHANMYQMPFTNGSFDTITIDDVLNEAENPAAAVAEAARILRVTGCLLLIEKIPSADGVGDPEYTGPRRWLRDAGLTCSSTVLVPKKSPAIVLCLGQKKDATEKAA
ncbi:MAG: metalloregulator ArsR/SmtB family transcription factor [Gammaproteobacteria bacterium]|nr:metalloregulator ArsR/SmtB family transcription factor [Gammaproteobacteria bacterium]